ncbi:hypothetical protein AN958_06747 [Leucoagaricus sp. SymC.cos]|nr:hypothetical protein AN958_06747 [Leucoagaricus sp. SymC.cos]
MLLPRDCSSQVASSSLARRERRGHEKRTFETDVHALTCVVAPEVALGAAEDYTKPVRNGQLKVLASPLNCLCSKLLRQNLREDQRGSLTRPSGLQVTLDIGVVDVTTCEPMPNVMVEVWSPNALGTYGSTFLRGAFTSATNGVAEFQTIYPGRTSNGANHINLMIHTSDSMFGTVSHVGQVFFTDRWNEVVQMTSPYNQNTNPVILNSQDLNYATANSEGYNAVMDIQSIHDDWPEGVIAYITVGVNPQRKVEVPQ